MKDAGFSKQSRGKYSTFI